MLFLLILKNAMYLICQHHFCEAHLHFVASLNSKEKKKHSKWREESWGRVVYNLAGECGERACDF